MKNVEGIKISKKNMLKICGIIFCNIQIIVGTAVLYFVPKGYCSKGIIIEGLVVLFLYSICRTLIYNSKNWTLEYSKLDKYIRTAQLSFLFFLLFFFIIGIILKKNNIIQANVVTFCNLCIILFCLGRFHLNSVMDGIIKNSK